MTLSSLDIITILILLTHKHGILFHLFVSSSVSFIIVLFFSVQIFHFLVNIIHSYFIVFDATVNKIIFIILFSLLLWMKLFLFQMVLLLVYRNISSVQFSRSVVSDSLWPHESQHARPPCPSPTPRVYSNSCPSSQWCHPAISSSVVPLSSCSQSLPASGFFQRVNSLHEVAKVLEFQLQHQSFQWTPRTDLL